MDQLFEDEAGRTYAIVDLDEKDGKWSASISWISHAGDPAREKPSSCLLPDTFDSEEQAIEAAHEFAKNNRPE